jgi:3-methyladenine DNA glycosylase AlkD
MRPVTCEEIIERLRSLADPEKVRAKEEKFGVVAPGALGVYMADLSRLAKEIGRNSDLALELWDSGIYEARLLCSKVFAVRDLREDLMETWIKAFHNWEICDAFCLGLFAKSSLARKKIYEWADREPEIERRAAFATLAGYCLADKKAENEVFLQFFPLIREAAGDDRIYVKKAVNWALRNIGKRNPDLKAAAIREATVLQNMDHRAAKWIGSNALRELEQPGVRLSNYPRSLYPKK